MESSFTLVQKDVNFNLTEIPLFTKLKKGNNILIAGAGGGFDVFAGVPLYLALREMGKNVYLANLSSTMLSVTDAQRIHNVCWKVEAGEEGHGIFVYFPEKHLCNWFTQRGDDLGIYAFEKSGVLPLKSAYEKLVQDLNLDTIVLIDGGTDSLMFGDEAGLGTPGEDSSSLVAISQLNGVEKILTCLGFGVDSFHGVSHYQFLENVAKLSRKNAYLGNFSLLPSMPEAQAFQDAVRYSNDQMPANPDILANSISSALQGQYGDFHATHRTQGSRLWINPLMYIYWSFDLMEVAKNLMYYDEIAFTSTYTEIINAIFAFRKRTRAKSWQDIPL